MQKIEMTRYPQPSNKTLFYFAIPFGIGLNCWNWLCMQFVRVEIDDHGNSIFLKPGQRYFRDRTLEPNRIYACWHQMTFVPIYTYGKQNVHVFISDSFKGYILFWWIRIQGHVGVFVNETNERSKAKATAVMLRALTQGFDIMITPDGPKGPFHVWNEGVDFIASKSGIKVTKSEFSYRGLFFKMLWRWDQYFLPGLFSKFKITLSF